MKSKRKRLRLAAAGAVSLAATLILLGASTTRTQIVSSLVSHLGHPASLTVADGHAIVFTGAFSGAEQSYGVARVDMETGELRLLDSGAPEPGFVTVDGVGAVYWTSPSQGVIFKATRPDAPPVRLLTGLNQPSGVAVDGLGRVYFTEVPAPGSDAAVNQVWMYDGTSKRVLTTGQETPVDIAAGRRGDLYWTAESAGFIVHRFPDGRTEVLQSGLDSPHGIALDEGSGKLYFTELPTPGVSGDQGGRNAISVLDLASGDRTVLRRGDRDPVDVAVGRNGGVLVASGTSGSIMVVSHRDDNQEMEVEDGGRQTSRFSATLSGASEVPPVTTEASGKAKLVLQTAAGAGDDHEGDDSGDHSGDDSGDHNGDHNGDDSGDHNGDHSGDHGGGNGGGNGDHSGDDHGEDDATSMSVSGNAPRLKVHLSVFHIGNVSSAELDMGAEGENGPVVAVLADSSMSNRRNEHGDELEVEATVSPDSLIGPLAGDWDGFTQALQAGMIYINVRTDEYPDGEVRGQVIPKNGISNSPPDGTILEPAGDVTVNVGDPVTFAGTATDPDGDMVTVLWDFGDGSTSTQLTPGEHTYTMTGAYTVTFTATDSNGLSDPTPATRTITVTQAGNNPPNGTITSPSGNPTITEGQSVSFAGAASDPDGDAVTVLWDFGDGSTSTQLSPGAHTYSAAGVYVVSLTATDSKGLSDPTPDTRTVTVGQAGNNPPDGTITSPSGNPTITEGQSVSFAGTASDPDGDAVTVLWDFGDGSTSTALSPGAHVYSTAGTYTVTFTATDSNGLSDPTPDTRTVTVDPATTAPTFTMIQTQIFTPVCTACHVGSSPPAGLNLEAGQSYDNLVNVPSTSNPSIPRVDPGNPDNSYLVIQLEGGHRNRPQSEIQMIRDWISAGAPNN